jgi:hypothetical protein
MTDPQKDGWRDFLKVILMLVGVLLVLGTCSAALLWV